MENSLTKESQVLLLLVAKNLFGYEEEINLDGINLKELYEEAKAQTVMGIAFESLPKMAKDMDEEIYSLWRQTAFFIVKKTLDNIYANVKITEVLSKSNIPHTTIKGYSSACYYPNPSIRQMGDVDFYIDESNQDRAIEVLLDNGYVRRDHDEHPFHIAFSKNKICYELHTAVTTVPEGKEHIMTVFDDLLQECKCIDSGCGGIIIPSKHHHGIIMLLHMQRHMVEDSGIGLRHLVDWAVFVNSIDNDEWKKTFQEKLKKIGLWKFARFISKAASIYIKLPQKEWFSDVDDNLASALIYDIFDSGNFGRKNEIRGMQKIMNGEGNRNKVIRLFRGTTNWIYSIYPICKKYKILFPIIYVGHTFKVLFKLIFKRADYQFSEVLRGGEVRYNTYDALCFFKEEK